MQYRRAKIKGGTYFFTVNLQHRNQTLLVDYIHALRETIKYVKERHPFNIDAMVVMPNHLHTIWTLPNDDMNFATRWMLIKSYFSRHISPDEERNQSRLGKGERGIWQRRYWEHLIQDEDDYENHVNYIHYNPVKHGYVKRVVDWPYSSFHRYVADGLLPCDWGSSIEVSAKSFGEMIE